MLVVIHDEHGGFFDHVAPLPVKIPVPAGALYPGAVRDHRVRVPALIASPFVRAGRATEATSTTPRCSSCSPRSSPAIGGRTRTT